MSITNDYRAFDTDFETTVDNKSPASKKNKTGLTVGFVVGAGVLGFLSILMIFYVVQRRKESPANDDEGQPLLDLNLLHVDAGFLTFKFVRSIESSMQL